MAHILEFTDPKTTYSVGDVIDCELTHLLVRMRDFMSHCDSKDVEIIKSWRDEITMIRGAVNKAIGGGR